VTGGRLLDELRRWRSWARGLLKGHAQVPAAGRSPQMTLLSRRRGTRVMAGARRLDQRLNLALRLFFSTRAGGRAGREAAPARSRPGTARVSGGRGRRGRELIVHAERPAPAAMAPTPVVLRLRAPAGPAERERPRAGVAARTTELTTRRLVEQRRRTEQLARDVIATGPSTPGVDPETGWPLPVGPAAASVRTQPRDRPELVPAASPAGTRPGAADIPAASALDIGRLADRVVAQIDRRIVAHRERMGRI
jgi:hypothetical protein